YMVTPGLAIDCCGREIRILKQIELKLPEPPPKRTEIPCPDDANRPPEPPADEGRHKQHHEPQGGTYYGGYAGEPQGEADEDEEHPDPYNPCDDTPEPYDLFLAIRYVECETEFSPAPFDDCNCNSDGEQP